MKILVAVKRVIDPYVKVRVKTDNSGVETQQVKMAINPFDEIALEAALQLREKNLASEVVLVTVGNDVCQETLRQGLAMGADRAVLVRSEAAHCSLQIAQILQKIVMQEQPGFIIMGKQSIDGDNNQTPQMLSALLGWPQGTFASKLLLEGDTLQVTREIDGGLETLAVTLPAVVSTDLRLNEPRYATLPNIMKARNKPLVIIDLASLALTLKAHQETISISAPAGRSAGIKLDSVASLLDKLQNEAKVL